MSRMLFFSRFIYTPTGEDHLMFGSGPEVHDGFSL